MGFIRVEQKHELAVSAGVERTVRCRNKTDFVILDPRRVTRRDFLSQKSSLSFIHRFIHDAELNLVFKSVFGTAHQNQTGDDFGKYLQNVIIVRNGMQRRGAKRNEKH